MPTGNLPSSGKKLWEDVYDKSLKGSCKGDKECAARTAWSAVKGAGWSKDKEGNWHKKAELQEFALTIKRLSIDPATQEKRWKADTSDIITDSRGDNMTVELFKSFINKILNNEPAPEEYKSDFWAGGMPYLSVSHYSDLDGKGVPGEPQSVYVDGRFLKAKGVFYNTPLGEAAWKALMEDKETERQDKVRISIGFLDYGHVHKSSNFQFKRESLDDVCPECMREIVNGEYSGKSFTDGMLVHFAMTRVPVNKRTDISPDLEVKADMTTQKEDAASIVGEEYAADLDEMEKKLNKKALVEFSETEVEEKAEGKKCPECGSTLNSDGSCPKCDKKDEDMEEEACATKKKEKKAEVSLSDVIALIQEMKSSLEKQPEPEQIPQETDEVQKSELYPIFKSFVLAYEEVNKAELSEDDKLRAIQTPFNELGTAIVSKIKKPAEPKKEEPQNDLVKALSEVMTPIAQKLDLLLQSQSERSEVPSRVPSRRSLNPSIVTPQLLKQEAEQEAEQTSGKPMSIANFAKKSVGGLQ